MANKPLKIREMQRSIAHVPYSVFVHVWNAKWNLLKKESTRLIKELDGCDDIERTFAILTRLKEIEDMYDIRKELRKAFTPRYFTVVDGMMSQFASKVKAYAAIGIVGDDWEMVKGEIVEDTETQTKVCTECKVEKSYTDFNKHPETTSGRIGKCKVCTLKSQRERRARC